MPEGKEGSPAAMNRTAVERKSDRELVVTRTFNAPAHIVFEAWSKPELFKRWWVRSEEHTSELQSPDQLVCRLLLEKVALTTTIYTLSLHDALPIYLKSKEKADARRKRR